MKKKFLLFMLLLLCLTGCFQKDPIDVLKESAEVLSEAKSIEMNATLVAKIKEEGTSIDINLPINVTTSVEGNNSVSKLSVKENMFTSAFEAYINLSETKFDAYLPTYLLDNFYAPEYEINWNHKWVSYSETINQEDIDEEYISKLENINIKEIVTKDNFVFVDEEDNIKHYNLIINDELLRRLATYLGEEHTEDSLNMDLKLDIYINTDTYEITKIYVNIKEVLKDMDIEELPLESIEELSMTIELKNYNNANIKVPQEVLNDTMTFDEYLNSLMGEE